MREFELMFDMWMYTRFFFGRSKNCDYNTLYFNKFVRLRTNSQAITNLVKGTHFQSWKKQIARTYCQLGSTFWIAWKFVIQSAVKTWACTPTFNGSMENKLTRLCYWNLLNMLLLNIGRWEGHFRVPRGLCFKTRVKHPRRNYYTFNSLSLFWLADIVQWILKVSAWDVI